MMTDVASSPSERQPAGAAPAARIWYVLEEGAPAGPYPDDVMVSLVRSGRVKPHDYVWTVGQIDWRPAGEIGGLFTPPTIDSVPDVNVQGYILDAKVGFARLLAYARILGRLGYEHAQGFARWHWEGAFDLRRALIIYCLVFPMLIGLLILGFVVMTVIWEGRLRENDTLRTLQHVFFLGCFLALFVWASVGLWRSTSHYVEAGGTRLYDYIIKHYIIMTFMAPVYIIIGYVVRTFMDLS